MVYCSQCGTKNEGDAHYCVNCGASLQISQNERRASSLTQPIEDECFGFSNLGVVVALIFGSSIIIFGLLTFFRSGFGYIMIRFGEWMGNWGKAFGEWMGNWGKAFGEWMGHWGKAFGEWMGHWGKAFGELVGNWVSTIGIRAFGSFILIALGLLIITSVIYSQKRMSIRACI